MMEYAPEGDHFLRAGHRRKTLVDPLKLRMKLTKDNPVQPW
jgi:hypothetical protein